MAHRIGTDRNQLLLLPPSLDEFIGEDNPAKVIDVFVDSLDLNKTGFKNSIPVEQGCPPYNPADLLKLYLYGYMNRIRSVSYTHLRAHETRHDLVCRLLLEKK